MLDLFGNNTPLPSAIPHHGYKRIFYVRRYRRSIDKTQQCKTCTYLRKKEGYRKSYYKCFLVGSSSSPATDIRLRNVCDLWDMEVKNRDDLALWLGTVLKLSSQQVSQISNKLNQMFDDHKDSI